MIWLLIGVVLVLLVLATSVRILKEYERGVAFRLGRLRGPLGPGFCLVVPGLDKLVRVDLRVVTLTIPPQEVITRDNVPARVNAVVLFRVTDPERSVMVVENHAVATSQIAQTTLRSVVGRADLDTLLAHRADLNEDLAILDRRSDRAVGGRGRGRGDQGRRDPRGDAAGHGARSRGRTGTPRQGDQRARRAGGLRSSCATPRSLSARAPPASSCGISRRCSSWAPTRTPPSSSPSRWTSSAPSWTPSASRRRRAEESTGTPLGHAPHSREDP